METDARAQVWAKTNGHCWYCGKLMNPWSDFTVDHMDPRKQGGGDEITNLVPCCKPCNSQKHAKTVVEYKKYIASKNEHIFWFERHEPLLKIYDSLEDEGREEREPDYISRLGEFVSTCLRVGLVISPGFVVTMLCLFQDSLDDYQEEEASITGHWFFHVEELAEQTKQTIDDVFGHLMSLHSNGIIEISWNQGPQNGHSYIFHIDRMLSLDEEIKARRLKQRREQQETNGS